MNKVLIIGHFWPYRGGSGRVIGLAKCLPQFGWQPIILTAPLHQKPDPQFRVIETYGYDAREDIGVQLKKRLNLTSHKSYEHIKPFLSFVYKFYRGIVNYPDTDKHWKSFAIKASDDLFRNEDIGAIISIWPVTCHIVAKELKKKYKIRWIADFPDLWSQNHNYSYGPVRKLIDKRLEIKTIRSADALTTVSQPWAEDLKMLHKRKSVYAITHGFDPDTLNTPLADLTAKFTITYAGAIYKGKQDPSKLFVALRDLVTDGTINPNYIEVRFYGLGLGWLQSKIEEYGLSAIAKYYGTVPPEIAFEKQRESQLLLLLNWNDYRVKGWHSLKIYTYLGARRPILAIGGFGNDVIEGLLDETKAGMYCKTAEDIKNVLSKLYLEYKRKGKVSYKGDIERINKYSYQEMARKFADVLNSLIQKVKKPIDSE